MNVNTDKLILSLSKSYRLQTTITYFLLILLSICLLLMCFNLMSSYVTMATIESRSVITFIPHQYWVIQPAGEIDWRFPREEENQEIECVVVPWWEKLFIASVLGPLTNQGQAQIHNSQSQHRVALFVIRTKGSKHIKCYIEDFMENLNPDKFKMSIDKKSYF